MRRVSALLALAAGLPACGGPLSETPIGGDYVRGAFHLYLWCPGGEHTYRAEDLLYPVNYPGQTWSFVEDESDVTVTWDGVPIAQGRRTTEGITLDFERADPFSAPVDWRFHGRLEENLRFHDRTIVGRIESGTRDGCLILPDSVAWFTIGERETDRELDPDAGARARGGWGRFVWFLDVGPYGMSRKGDPGQRGRNLRMFSFAATGGGAVTAGDDAAFFDNGFGTAWPGAARGRAAEFEQPEEYWDLEYRQDVLWDDGGEDGVGIHRVLAGFVGGRYRVVEQNYPPGWEGETGMLPLKNPGMAFWLDLVRGEEPAPQSAAGAAGARVIARETVEGVESSPAIRLLDGVPAW